MLSLLLFLGAVLFTLPLSAATNDLSAALQRGLFEEEANRNLQAAIEAYEAVAKQFDQNRALAATAIFRLGEVNRKLGHTNEAAAFYRRILREFGDQETLATLSRQNLVGMGAELLPAASATDSSAWQERHARQRALLQEEIQLVETQLAARRALSAGGRASQDEVFALQRDLLSLQRQLTAFDASIPGFQPIRLDPSAWDDGTAQRDTSVAAASTVGDEEETEIRRVQAMIQNSPDLINAPAGEGNLTPLCRAASKGQLRVARFLIGHGAARPR